MIFAKVDVDLSDHPRLVGIPAKLRDSCLGLWLRALLYTRKHLLDGFCPLEAIHVVASDERLGQLERVGLISREEGDCVHGIRILRYAEHNETRDAVQTRIEMSRERVQRWRTKRVGNALHDPLPNALRDAYVIDQISESEKRNTKARELSLSSKTSTSAPVAPELNGHQGAPLARAFDPPLGGSDVADERRRQLEALAAWDKAGGDK